jgi:CTP:molybdopterin cytidylyltransferase MocA
VRAVEGAVIAAAGLGSRLGLGLPKAMLEIDGLTVLSRLIHTLEASVPRIHVVVGYREELITQHCARHHRSVVIVRNPDFRTTNTARSMSLGGRGFRSKVVFLDGDLIVSPASMDRFLARAANEEVLLGTTPAGSEQAVYVHLDSPEGTPGSGRVTRFSRSESSAHEWASVLVAPPDLLDDVDGFVFEYLEGLLPIPAQSLTLCEVDTPGDLEVAERFVRDGFADD